ncbi:MAG: MBL fold metallo-hydrolase [Wenzhouxiangellaceae bacterium]
MTELQYYLREDVYFEPLFNQWYAWPYLIPPVTAARHMVKTHRRIMKSFLNNAELHVLASQDKSLAGGDYLNCPVEQLPAIEKLVNDIDLKCGDLVALSSAIEELDALIRAHTSGESITPLYDQLPEMLKGYVELFFDMEHNPSYRFIEPLLYRSSYYKQSLQSISLGMLSRVDARPFVFSTPRLVDEDHLQAHVDFNHPLIDRLFSSRCQPLSQMEIDSLFDGVELSGGLKPEELFTTTRPQSTLDALTDGVRLTYTGHAGFMLQTPNVTIMVDPVLSSREFGSSDGMVSFPDLPEKIDYVCLTHNHQDHVNLETLLQLRYKTEHILVPKNNGGSLADPSIRLLLQQLGFKVSEVEDLDVIGVADGKIVSVPFLGEHGDLNIRSKTAWYVELCGRKFFFGADSSNPDRALYEHLGEIFRPLDVLAIGMECVGAPYTWLYGALHTKPVSKSIKNSRRLNGSDCEQALPMVSAFAADRVCIYALGLEPCYKYFMGLEYDDDSKQIEESKKMIQACNAINVPAEALNGRKVLCFESR